ncbi:hypothetical protein RB598_009775 [Gaeumannomyces tritici]
MQTQSVLPETLQSSKRQHDQRDATMAADDDGTTPSYGDHSSSYWAPGWNYQRYSNATTEDILGLAPGELLKMQAGLRDVLGEQGVVAMARHNFARSLPTAEEAMATPNVEAGRRCSDGALMSDAFEGHAQGSEAVQGAPEEAVCVDIPPNWLRLWVKRHEGEPWGFVAIRAACYGGEGEEEEEEARWARFKEAFGKMVEVPFDWAAKRTSSGEAVARGRAAFEKIPRALPQSSRGVKTSHLPLRDPRGRRVGAVRRRVVGPPDGRLAALAAGRALRARRGGVARPRRRGRARGVGLVPRRFPRRRRGGRRRALVARRLGRHARPAHHPRRQGGRRPGRRGQRGPRRLVVVDGAVARDGAEEGVGGVLGEARGPTFSSRLLDFLSCP